MNSLNHRVLLLSLIFIKACGGGGGGGDAETIAAVAEAVRPVISSASNFTVSENQTSIGTALASISNYSSLSYSLSGADASAISINSSTGVMTFNSAPDFETKNSYALKLNVAAGSVTTSQDITIAVTDDSSDNTLACKTATYLTTPAASSSDSVMNYYTYSWQSLDFESLPICLNYYEATSTITSPWKTYLQGIYDYSKFTVGQVVPVNAFILAENRASISSAEALQFNTDFCTVVQPENISACVSGSDPFSNRSAAGGVGHSQLPNSGDQQLFQDILWGAQDTKTAIKIIAHEYFHVHQNGLKFIIEANNENNKFAIPKAWPGNEAAYDNATIPQYMPNWIEEGGAEFGGIIIGAKYMESAAISGSDPVKLVEEHFDEAFNYFAANASLSLEDFNMGDNNGQNPGGQYSAGLAALMYLWNQDDDNYQKIMIDYYANWAEAEALRAGYGWSDAFKNTFKKNGSPYEITSFYNDFNTWIRSDTKENLKATLKTKNQMLHADLVTTTENTPKNITITAAPKVIDNGGVNKYFIDGVQQKSLVLKSGKTYTFTYPSGHPFRFSQTIDGTHGSGVTFDTNVDTSGSSSVTFAVTSSTPKTLYYFCTVHSGMGGTIKIVD
tara:strand:- start:80 stop:1927 length:1848 start_codon:yes stop_codon:yes gene_type:complete